jgi:dienelactone hydrolase
MHSPFLPQSIEPFVREPVMIRARPRSLRRPLALAGGLALLAIVFLSGTWVGYHERWPFGLIHRARSVLHLRRSVAVLPARLRGVDLGRTITVASAADVETRRRQVQAVIWGDAPLPLTRLPTVEAGITDRRWQPTPGVARIDRLTITLPGGVHSVAYHFIPAGRAHSTLLIFHQGHSGDFLGSRDTISRLVSRGYPVIALAMPLLGLNDRPTARMAGGDDVLIESHNQMALLDYPLQYFIEPVVVAVNYARGRLGAAEVGMIGISGGAWTTTVAAAVDPRIRFVFPVAGSLPLTLRSRSWERDGGDFEQLYPPLLRVASYLDLYVLGATGEGRQQLMIYNDEDPCCFAGSRAALFAPSVTRRVRELGTGRFDLLVDRNDEHSLSDAGLDRIFATLESSPPG